jgi:Lon protease-like protein
MKTGMPDFPIPLFPLPNVVHFPDTVLRLHVFEPRYRQMVADLMSLDPKMRWIGMTLLRPVQPLGEEHLEIFEEGTAGLLTAVEPLPDGRSTIDLEGGFRFLVEREIEATPYRRAVVRPLPEPELEGGEVEIRALRLELVRAARSLAREMGANFPVEGETIEGLAACSRLAGVVNRLAADLDLPVLRKQALLVEDLEERGASILRILRSRQRVLDLLRPYRRPEPKAARN